jgi:hypothetical protein
VVPTLPSGTLIEPPHYPADAARAQRERLREAHEVEMAQLAAREVARLKQWRREQVMASPRARERLAQIESGIEVVRKPAEPELRVVAKRKGAGR